MKRVLASLDRRWLQAASRELCHHLSAWIDAENTPSIRKILAFIPFFPGEVDLASFIGEQFGQREVYLPRVHAERQMSFIAVGEDWFKNTVEGHLGVPGPNDSAGQPFLPEENSINTLVLVPALAFDLRGNRLGRGMGYYDRFLGQAAMSSVVRMGVGWSLQMTPHISRRDHDVSMDWICNEEGVQHLAAMNE